MSKNLALSILMISGLGLLLLGCQTVTNLAASNGAGTAAASQPWPHSTFVPEWESLTVGVGQALLLESHHLSPNRFGRLEIQVDGQPLGGAEATPPAATFPDTLATLELATIKVLTPTIDFADGVCIGALCDKVTTTQLSIERLPLRTSSVQSKYPNSTWTVFLVWTGYVPGTYDLSLQVIDNAQQKGPRITQRIKVVK